MRRLRAFTLIELLVVISVIALLVGILLPVLGAARESGRASVCLSNLRQFAIAATSYATDERDTLPLSFDYASVPNRQVHWDFETDLITFEVTPGLMWRGQTDPRVHQCPSFDGDSATLVNEPHTGYNYNTSYLGGFLNLGANPLTDLVPSARLDEPDTPSETVIFGDGEFGGGANKSMRAPRINAGLPNAAKDPPALFTGREAGTQGYRHLGATQLVHVDGHGEAENNRFTTGDLTGPVAEETGFLSADNSVYDLE